MLAVLIHAGCQANAVREAQPHDFNRIFREGTSYKFLSAKLSSPVKVQKNNVVSLFRGKTEQN